MTVNQEARYKASSARNVHNFLNRFRGVNTGNAETRALLLRGLGEPASTSMESLKHRLGVRLTGDSRFDTELQPVVSLIQSQKKKPPAGSEEKRDIKIEAADVSEDLPPKGKFKKGNPDKVLDKSLKKWTAKAQDRS